MVVVEIMGITAAALQRHWETQLTTCVRWFCLKLAKTRRGSWKAVSTHWCSCFVCTTAIHNNWHSPARPIPLYSKCRPAMLRSMCSRANRHCLRQRDVHQLDQSQTETEVIVTASLRRFPLYTLTLWQSTAGPQPSQDTAPSTHSQTWETWVIWKQSVGLMASEMATYQRCTCNMWQWKRAKKVRRGPRLLSPLYNLSHLQGELW